MSRRVRTVYLPGIALLWICATGLASAAEAGKAIFVHGTVTVERPQSVELKKGDAVAEGDVVVTAERSRAQFLMKDGAKLALKPGTRLVIDEYFEEGDEVTDPGGAVVVADGGSSVTTLIKGGFRTITGAIADAEPEAYEARTPVATLGIRGTDFTVIYCNAVTSPCTTPSGEDGPADGLYVGVASGSVEMNNSAGGLVLDAGQYGAVENEDTPPKRLPGPPPAVYANEAVGGEEAEESEEEAAEEEAVAATEEEVVAVGESSEGDGQAATEATVVASDDSENSAQAASGDGAVTTDGSADSDGQPEEGSAVASSETQPGGEQVAGGGDAAAFAGETDVSAAVAPISSGSVPPPNPVPITVAVVAVQTATVDIAEPDVDVDVIEPPVIEVIAEDESGDPVDLDSGTPIDPETGDPVATDFRDVSFATGPLLATPGFTGATSNFEDEFAFGPQGAALVAFSGPSPGNPETVGTDYAIGTASSLNVGFDPISGMRWGRWSEGSATVVPPGAGSTPLALVDQSLHWVIGPLSGAPPVIPQGGSATYDLIVGNTDPTDNLGNVGVLGSADLLADFTNQTVMADVLVSIAGSIWSGNGSGALNGNLFGGVFSTVLIDSTPGAGGRFSGFLSGLNQAAGDDPTGAGLSYEMENLDGGVVTGVVVFGPPRP